MENTINVILDDGLQSRKSVKNGPDGQIAVFYFNEAHMGVIWVKVFVLSRKRTKKIFKQCDE